MALNILGLRGLVIGPEIYKVSKYLGHVAFFTFNIKDTPKEMLKLILTNDISGTFPNIKIFLNIFLTLSVLQVEIEPFLLLKDSHVKYRTLNIAMIRTLIQ